MSDKQVRAQGQGDVARGGQGELKRLQQAGAQAVVEAEIVHQPRTGADFAGQKVIAAVGHRVDAPVALAQQCRAQGRRAARNGGGVEGDEQQPCRLAAADVHVQRVRLAVCFGGKRAVQPLARLGLGDGRRQRVRKLGGVLLVVARAHAGVRLKAVAEGGGAGVPGFELRCNHLLPVEQGGNALLDLQRGNVFAQAKPGFGAKAPAQGKAVEAQVRRHAGRTGVVMPVLVQIHGDGRQRQVLRALWGKHG